MAQSQVELCIDAMYVNKMPFLTSILRHIKFRTSQWVPGRTTGEYRKQLTKLLHLYKTAGFPVCTISCDNEFRPVLELMKDEFQFKPNYASAQEHVPEAERNHCVIKERVRACFHNAPFKSVPHVAAKYLVTESTAKLNYFPAQGGCSKVYSLHHIILQKPLIYKLHCKIPTLQTVLAHHEPTPLNSMHARAIEGLYLGPTKNAQGGHKIYNLETQSVITRKYMTKIPATPAMIQRVNGIAKLEGMHNITITSKTGELLYDSALLAGVEEDDKQDDQDDQDNNDNPNQDNADDPNQDEDLEPEPEADEVDPNEVYEDNDTENPIKPESAEATSTPVPEQEQESDKESIEPTLRRSSRNVAPPERLEPKLKGQTYNQVESEPKPDMEYNLAEAKILAMIMCQFNNRWTKTENIVYGTQHVVTYSLKKGIQKFGERGQNAAHKEMKQLHDRECFNPIHKHTLNETEWKRALKSLIFLTEKKNGTIKARHCANGTHKEIT